MESYESTCQQCGHRWSWVGYKTGIGKTQAQLDAMDKAGKTCPAAVALPRWGWTMGMRPKRQLDSRPGCSSRRVDMDFIALDQCHPRHLYLLHSRNLTLGVYDGHGGFIGIREKFGNFFLFTEYHWERLFATVRPLEDLGEIPAELIVATDLGSIDDATGRAVDFDRPVADGGRGWFFTDNGEAVGVLQGIRLVWNKGLFDWLVAQGGRP